MGTSFTQTKLATDFPVCCQSMKASGHRIGAIRAHTGVIWAY